MATSYIEYKEKGFWSNDTFIELSVQYIINFFNTKSSEEEWIEEYINDWLFYIAKGNFPGFIDMKFEEYMVDERMIKKFVSLVQATKMYLLTKDDMLSSQELNGFIISDKLQSKWTQGLPTAIIIETLTKIELILTGQSPPDVEITV